MTKGGSGKSKTLGRLIFGEKRKQHASPARHRSSARNGTSTTDLPSSTAATTAAAAAKTTINLHDWAVWRMQLNEQMGTGATERRTDLKQMRQFLQSNPFYQQHSHDPSTGRYNGVHLLFSIPHAKINPEFLNDPQASLPTNDEANEAAEPAVYEPKKLRSNSDDRTTTSVNSISALPPVAIDKTVAQLLPKTLTGSASVFLPNSEPAAAMDGMRTRRSTRSSFIASDRIHSTLQKAVKDGNVLEKIKAFEMQAAAAQAESISKLGTINHRMPPIHSIAHRTLSPATIHPIQKTISPMAITEQLPRSHRDRYVHPGQQRRDGPQASFPGHESRKGAHLLEPAHGDIILRRRTPSQKNPNDDDRSATAISSIAQTASQGHHRTYQHHSHQRTSVSRSRHRPEMNYEKRAPSHHEHYSRRHSSKQRGTTTPSGRSSTRRRWSKGRKEAPVEASSAQARKPDVTNTRANKNKKKTAESDKPDLKKVAKSLDKEKLASDNNRVYGVPTANITEQAGIVEARPAGAERGRLEKLNTFALSNNEDTSPPQPCDTALSRRPSQKYRQQPVSTINGEMLSKVPEKAQFVRSNNNHIPHSEHDDDDDEEEEEDDDEHTDDDVFLKETPTKPVPIVTRHQSIINLPKNESRCFQQQSSNLLRRHASQRSADNTVSDRACPLDANPVKKQQSPITLITRKHHMEPTVYEAPHSEQTQLPVCNTHTMKKKRPFHTINTAGCTMNSGQKTNNKQISKQILHAIMNSMNHNQESVPMPAPASPTSANDHFFDNGPLSNPEETIANMTTPS